MTESPSLSETTKDQAQSDLALQERGNVRTVQEVLRRSFMTSSVGYDKVDKRTYTLTVQSKTISDMQALHGALSAIQNVVSPQIQQSEGVVEAYLTDRSGDNRPLIHPKWDEKGAREAAKHYGVPVVPLVRGVPYEV